MSWASLLAFAVYCLRLSPAAFWALGFREFEMLARGLTAGNRPPDRAGLDEMMRRFPDRPPSARTPQ